MESGDVDVSVVDSVELAHHVGVGVGQHRLLQVGVLLLGHTQQRLPLVVGFTLLLLHGLGVLQHQVDLVRVALLEGSFEGLGVDFLQDCLESVEGLLEDLVPVSLGHVDDDRDEEGEGVALVGLEDVEEVVVFEEAHCPISHLEVKS